jgi:glycosyltransferase involved in cell wall biosynthesis
MGNPLVSVIVPVYNAAEYLAHCLDSIVAQTFSSIEVIIVNDGSVDNSSDIIETYLKKYTWFHCITQTNKGPGEARNVGIAASQGKYLAFVDADDYVTSDFIDVLFKLAEKNSADIAVCNFYIQLPNGIHFAFPFFTSISIMSGAEAARKTMDMFNLPGFAWDKLYRRELFTNNAIKYPPILYEDAVTICELMLNAKTVVTTKKPCYYYCRHKQSITSNFNVKYVNDYLTAASIMRNYLISRHLWDEWEKPYKEFLRRIEAHIFLEIGLKKRPHNVRIRKEEIRSIHKHIRKLMMKPAPGEDTVIQHTTQNSEGGDN